ncbi:MAG: hypothetical protein AB7I98_06270 [Verrucomicrobiales bacterium]
MNPTPPPLPPPVVPTRSPASKTSRLGCWIAAVVVIGLSFLLLLSVALPTYLKIKKRAPATLETPGLKASPQKPPQGNALEDLPLSEEEFGRLKTFGDDLAALLNTRQLEQANAFVDLAAVEARVFDGLELPGMLEGARKGFTDSLRQTGLLTQISTGNFTCLRARERDGVPVLLMRGFPPDGGVNYLDLVVRRDGDSFKVMDIFNYMFGSYVTSEARQAMASMLNDTSLLSRALGIPSESTKEQLLAIQKVTNRVKEGAFDEAVAAYHALPEKSRHMRVTFIAYLQSLQMLQGKPENIRYEAEYLEALEAAPGILKDATTELLGLDVHIIKKNWQGVYAALAKVAEVVGGDPFLHVLKGNVQILEGDLDGAAESVAAAEAEEPDLLALVDLRLAVCCGREDFPGVVKELRGLKERFGSVLLAKDLTEPQFEAFLRSPEYQSWEAENQ